MRHVLTLSLWALVACGSNTNIQDTAEQLETVYRVACEVRVVPEEACTESVISTIDTADLLLDVGCEAWGNDLPDWVCGSGVDPAEQKTPGDETAPAPTICNHLEALRGENPDFDSQINIFCGEDYYDD